MREDHFAVPATPGRERLPSNAASIHFANSAMTPAEAARLKKIRDAVEKEFPPAKRSKTVATRGTAES
jgi:hypothetical protein